MELLELSILLALDMQRNSTNVRYNNIGERKKEEYVIFFIQPKSVVVGNTIITVQYEYFYGIHSCAIIFNSKLRIQ